MIWTEESRSMRAKRSLKIQGVIGHALSIIVMGRVGSNKVFPWQDIRTRKSTRKDISPHWAFLRTIKTMEAVTIHWLISLLKNIFQSIAHDSLITLLNKVLWLFQFQIWKLRHGERISSLAIGSLKPVQSDLQKEWSLGRGDGKS